VSDPPRQPISRLPLARLPTPYDSAPRLARALGFARLHVKREDLAGPAFGGNKIRSLERILAAARAEGADCVLTSAASQSNFCRALAGTAPLAGLGCHLLLRRAGGNALTGNLLLMQLFGASIAWTEATDPWDPAIAAQLQAEAAALRRAGRRPFIVQLPGVTAPLAAAAWALAAEEMAEDFAASGSAPDLLALACGSGLTLAGLALGFARFSLPVRLLGVSVQQPAARLHPWVAEVVARTADLLGWEAGDAMAQVEITDDQVAPGYAQASPAGLAALAAAARCEGLVLDPSYTGKALAGLAARAAPGLSAAFLHSGGAPALFAQAHAVAAWLNRDPPDTA
jgi:1-aminocyclopropane-1-carboxylate deaminase/D-cysteine desulfhydrase-like pyridoxal-dependent ACC family enzyme